MPVAQAPAVATSLPEPRRLGLRLLTAGGVVILVGAAVMTLPGLEEVRRRFSDAVPGWLVASLGFQVASCLAFVAVYRGVFCRRLKWNEAYHLGIAVQGTNVLLPAGGASGLALGAWALHRLGMPAQPLAARTIAFFLITSSVNFACAVLAGSALAFALLPGDVPPLLAAVPAAAAAAVILGVLALPRMLPSRSRATSAPARLIGAAQGALNAGVIEAGTRVRSADLLVILGAVGYMGFDVLALGAAFSAVGSVPPLAVLLLAYVVGQLGGLIPLPGGVGGADGGLIAALVLYGTSLPEAVAAVLAYRAFQLCLPALLGTLAFLRLPRVLERAELGACEEDALPFVRPPSGLPMARSPLVPLP